MTNANGKEQFFGATYIYIVILHEEFTKFSRRSKKILKPKVNTSILQTLKRLCDAKVPKFGPLQPTN